VVDYYRDVATSTSLPLLAYHIPSLVAGLDFNTLIELMEIPNIVGMKYTEDNFEVLYKFIEMTDNKKIVFTGHDAMMLSGLVMGSDGAIGAFENIMPEGFSKAFRAFKAGDFVAAQQEQFRLNHFISIIKKYMLTANQAPIKAALKAYGVDVGLPKLPAKPTSDEAAKALVAELRAEGFFDLYK